MTSTKSFQDKSTKVNHFTNSQSGTSIQLTVIHMPGKFEGGAYFWILIKIPPPRKLKFFPFKTYYFFAELQLQ